MPDETSDLEEETQENKFDKRIKGLSEQKIKLTSERDEFAQANEKLLAEKESLTKEADFFKNFNSVIPKYQGAAEFQDKIKEKVMAGYDIEDATVAVLNKEGRFNPAPTNVRQDSPAGGSAINQIRSDGEKTVGEMTRDEKRAKLMENEAEMIDLLSPKIRM